MSLSLQDQYDKIYRYCYFKVKNQQLAEDLTQKTFLKFFSQTSYISRGKPLAYLYTIAKNLCIDSYKKEKTLPLYEDSENNIEGINNIEDFEMKLAVRQGVDTLPKDLQEIILLRFSNDLSMGEIGKIMGISRFAVYRRINKALGMLKNVLREEDFA